MSFDTLAPIYRGMEWILAGSLMQRCRVAFLPDVRSCRHALLLGEGPGRFVPELVRANPEVVVTCVERSPRMIDEAAARLNEEQRSRVHFEQADALTWTTRESRFDLVVTHFFLDCFGPEQLEALITKISCGATDDARWLLADFREPEKGWRRWRAGLVLACMYAFFRFSTGLAASKLTPPDKFLAANGFELMNRRLANFGLIHSDLWARNRG